MKLIVILTTFFFGYISCLIVNRPQPAVKAKESTLSPNMPYNVPSIKFDLPLDPIHSKKVLNALIDAHDKVIDEIRAEKQIY